MVADRASDRARALAGGVLGTAVIVPLLALAPAGAGAVSLRAMPVAEQEPSLEEAVDLHLAGRLDEALAAYRRVAGALGGTDPTAAGMALNNACAILMGRGEWEGARAECTAAEELLRSVAPEDRDLQGQNFNNLGVVHQVLGRHAEATSYFLSGLEISRELDDVESEAIGLANLGALATVAGQYGEALRVYEQVERLAGSHPDAAWAAEQSAVARVNRGVVFEKLGEYRQALDLYRGLQGAGSGLDPARRAALEVNLGVLYRNLGDPVRAMQAFESASVTYGALGDRSGLANAWLNRGIALHRDLDLPDQAEAAFRRALELARGGGDRAEEIQDLFYLGDLLLERGRAAEAEAAFRECLDVADAAGSAEGRWSARFGLGRAALHRGDLTTAAQWLGSAIEQIEAVGAGLGAGEARGGYLAGKRDVYAFAVGVQARLHRLDPGGGHDREGFRIAQRAKARDLLEALGEGAVPAAPVPVEALQARLGPDVALDYFFADETLVAWALNRQGLRMVELGKAEPTSAAARRAHARLAAASESAAADLDLLSERLVRPFAQELGGARRVVVAPDGPLHYLPYELLRAGSRSGGALVDAGPVSYLPALAMLRPASAGVAEGGFAAIGAPDAGDPGAGDAGRLRRMIASRWALPPLAEAGPEMLRVRDLLGKEGPILSGSAATEPGLRELTARRLAVLHLAAHTVLDEGSELGSAVLLAPAGADDGVLSAREIAGIPMDVRLVVLSACRTAPRPSPDGRALRSLTGAFLAAGAGAVIATLWDVEDAAARVFVEQLYYELGRGRDPAAALQAVKVRLRRDRRWSAPSTWAAWVLVGESGPVAAPRTAVPAWAWITALALLLAAIYGVSRRSRRGSR